MYRNSIEQYNKDFEFEKHLNLNFAATYNILPNKVNTPETTEITAKLFPKHWYDLYYSFSNIYIYTILIVLIGKT